MQQTISRPTPDTQMNNKGNTVPKHIFIVALILFALSGLITGFATATYVSPNQAQPSNPNMTTNKPVPAKTPTASPTQQVVKKQDVGCPGVTLKGGPPFVADGNLTYNLSAFVVDASKKTKTACNPGDGNHLHAPGIMLKLWLLKPDDQNEIKKHQDLLIDPANLQQKLPGELDKALIFLEKTPQVQPSNNNGEATWSFGIAPSVPEGTYYLSVINDWGNGMHAWSFLQIEVKHKK